MVNYDKNNKKFTPALAAAIQVFVCAELAGDNGIVLSAIQVWIRIGNRFAKSFSERQP